jgi:hypothetical protein
MKEAELIEAIRKDLFEGKGVIIPMQSKGSLCMLTLTPSHVYGRANEWVQVAMEGGGVYFYNGQEEVDPFVLVSHGFDLSAAASVVALLDKLMLKCRTRQRRTTLSGHHNTKQLALRGRQQEKHA